jgi:hypothetical protein
VAAIQEWGSWAGHPPLALDKRDPHPPGRLPIRDPIADLEAEAARNVAQLLRGLLPAHRWFGVQPGSREKLLQAVVL